MEIWGNLSFMQYTGIIFQVEGKKLLFFLMYPYIITYMIKKPMKFPKSQIYIFSSSEAPDYL